VRDAVFARAAPLGSSAKEILTAVAVVPPQVELWLLEALVGDDIGALDECLSAGMLTTETGGIAFRHELARLAVEDSITPTRKLELHRQALAELAAHRRRTSISRGSPIMRRRRATPRQSCGSRLQPGRVQPRSARTGRRQRSTRARSASATS
jgi:hypothetical protein